MPFLKRLTPITFIVTEEKTEGDMCMLKIKAYLLNPKTEKIASGPATATLRKVTGSWKIDNIDMRLDKLKPDNLPNKLAEGDGLKPAP